MIRVVFISGPYTATDAVVKRLNIERARTAAKQIWALNGTAVICPHANSAWFDEVADERHFLEGYLELVRRSDVVFLLPNAETSRGSRAEMALAASLGIPIFRTLPALEKWLDDRTVSGAAGAALSAG